MLTWIVFWHLWFLKFSLIELQNIWGLCFFLLFGFQPMDKLLLSLDTDGICEMLLVHSCYWKNI